MPEETIIIDIDEDGKIYAKTSGFEGDACMDKLQEILGNEQLFSEVKPQDCFYNKQKNTTIRTVASGRK